MTHKMYELIPHLWSWSHHTAHKAGESARMCDVRWRHQSHFFLSSAVHQQLRPLTTTAIYPRGPSLHITMPSKSRMLSQAFVRPDDDHGAHHFAPHRPIIAIHLPYSPALVRLLLIWSMMRRTHLSSSPRPAWISFWWVQCTPPWWMF